MSQPMYTQQDLEKMTLDEFAAARARGYVRPPAVVSIEPTFASPPSPLPQSPYAATSWGEGQYYDFTVPSGQKCQMQKLRPELLLGTNLMEKLTRLPGFAEEHIAKAEGRPPTPAMPEEEQLVLVMEVVDQLLPIVVVQPKVWPDPTSEQADPDPDVDNSERREGRVYVSAVDLADRIAILNRATRGVALMDNFRQEP